MGRLWSAGTVHFIPLLARRRLQYLLRSKGGWSFDSRSSNLAANSPNCSVEKLKKTLGDTRVCLLLLLLAAIVVLPFRVVPTVARIGSVGNSRF
jgi:hypothetical protein